jgi:hypothetical protein
MMAWAEPSVTVTTAAGAEVGRAAPVSATAALRAAAASPEGRGQETAAEPGGVNAPVLHALGPTSAAPGTPGLTLVLTGSGFGAQDVVRWNGQARATTRVSGSELRADLTAADLGLPTLATVSVLNTVNGESSLPLPFFVQDPALTHFFDDFRRSDSPDIGNGWTEKTANAFRLENSEVASFNNGLEFLENMLYRPASEDRLDAEGAVEFRRLPNIPDLNNANFPQLHVRVQRATLPLFFTLDSYLLFIDELSTVGPRAMLAISRSPVQGQRYECYIAPLPLPGPLVEGGRYRFRLQVTGAGPVYLLGLVEQYSSSGTWTLLASRLIVHEAGMPRDLSLFCDGSYLPNPFTTTGGSALSKWYNRTDIYDNFHWREVPGELVFRNGFQ